MSLNINDLDQDTDDSDYDASKDTDKCNSNKAKFTYNSRKEIDIIAWNWFTKLENNYFECKNEKSELDEMALQVIVNDSQAFNIFSKPAMKKFIQLLKPGYKPLSRKTAASHLKKK